MTRYKLKKPYFTGPGQFVARAEGYFDEPIDVDENGYFEFKPEREPRFPIRWFAKFCPPK